MSNTVVQDSSPLLRSQNIGEITALPGQRARLEYLLLAKPLSETPRYLFKFKDAPAIHVVKVPATSHLSLEREVLLRHGLPYAIATDAYLASHKAALQDGDNGPMDEAGAFLQRHAVDIALALLLLCVLKFGIPGMGVSANVIAPGKLKGSLDDLICVFRRT
ncbi:hypothetical protein [Janthinobacterium psychrotolerans]|uniref:hypothetical protein n=1 Tax=Janthinobacterium psychrotolerans TaxID=1747903 RepID=UPI0012379059|nr:hypothetical protein [Janthinobacterium psychrotolerans]